MLKFVVFFSVIASTLAVTAYQEIWQPCILHDHKCVGSYLAANSKCNKNVVGLNEDLGELFTKSFRFEAPYFNSTYIDNNLYTRNLDRCRVSTFYFNMTSNTAVIGLDCHWLELDSDRTLLQHNSLREDTTYHFHMNAFYPLVRLTTTLPHSHTLDLCSAFTFADVTALPIFKLDPLDKPTKSFLSTDLSYMNIYERESFFWRASYLTRTFINTVLCDFGCV